MVPSLPPFSVQENDPWTVSPGFLACQLCWLGLANGSRRWEAGRERGWNIFCTLLCCLSTASWPHSSVTPAPATQPVLPAPVLTELPQHPFCPVLYISRDGNVFLLLPVPEASASSVDSSYPINNSFIKVSSVKPYEWYSVSCLPRPWQWLVNRVPLYFERRVSWNTWRFLSKHLRPHVCWPCSCLELDLEIFHNLGRNPCVLFPWFNSQTCDMKTYWRNIHGLTHCGNSTDMYSRVGVEKSGWALFNFNILTAQRKCFTHPLHCTGMKNHCACLSWGRVLNSLLYLYSEQFCTFLKRQALNPESWVMGSGRRPGNILSCVLTLFKKQIILKLSRLDEKNPTKWSIMKEP